MGVMTIGDAADRMAKNFDGRLREMLIVVRRTRFTQILEFPGLLRTGLNVHPGLDAGQFAQRFYRQEFIFFPSSPSE
jgi:hypothetical protein